MLAQVAEETSGQQSLLGRGSGVYTALLVPASSSFLTSSLCVLIAVLRTLRGLAAAARSLFLFASISR